MHNEMVNDFQIGVAERGSPRLSAGSRAGFIKAPVITRVRHQRCQWPPMAAIGKILTVGGGPPMATNGRQ